MGRKCLIEIVMSNTYCAPAWQSRQIHQMGVAAGLHHHPDFGVEAVSRHQRCRTAIEGKRRLHHPPKRIGMATAACLRSIRSTARQSRRPSGIPCRMILPRAPDGAFPLARRSSDVRYQFGEARPSRSPQLVTCARPDFGNQTGDSSLSGVRSRAPMQD
jgi:hypothetical protein